MSVFRPAQGDLVHLVAECRSEWTGRIYEIGTPARVVGARGSTLTLEVGAQTVRDSLHCSTGDVAHERSTGPRQATPWYRRRARVGAA